MRRLLTVFALVAITSVAAVAAEDKPTVSIGIVYDGEWSILDEMAEGIERELAILAGDEFTVRYPEFAQRNGEWQLQKIDHEFRDLLEDERVDIVIAAGLAASQIACSIPEGFDKPVLAPLSLDTEIQALPRSGAGSGVRNLSYVAMPSTLRRELLAFQELVPFKKVGLIANREVLEAMPTIAPNTMRQLEGTSIDAVYISADRTADSVFSALPDDIQAVYVWPLLLDDGEIDKLTEGLNQRRMPSFSWLGREQVVGGMYATLTADAGRSRLARRIALNVQQILLGTPPEELGIDFVENERLILNVETARRIGAWPRYESLLEAELVGDYGSTSLESVTLFAAVHRAVEANRTLIVERAGLRATAQDQITAKTVFRPSLDGRLSASQIDSDRAAASFGNAPETTTIASVELNQLIYSDGANASLQIERALQRSREMSLEQARLDVALEASIAYINLLRAANQLDIQLANLDLTRSNLELARSRSRIGTATQSEIYRWESQMASARRNLVDADATRRQALVTLNQLLNEPMDREILPVDIDLQNPDLSPGSGLLDGYIETPFHFRVLTEFVVLEGLERSPELGAIDESLQAQRRARLQAKRSFYAPTVALQGTVDERLSASGDGVPMPGPLAPDDTNWSLGLAATLPIYTGGERRSLFRQSDFEVTRLEEDRQRVSDQIERAIREALIAARASYTGISLAQDAELAAKRNLSLVQDAYARGAVPIIDLIDAQNAGLAAEVSATDAIYDFLIDLMQVQRTSNRFDFFTSPADRQAWASRMQRYFAERNIQPWGTTR